MTANDIPEHVTKLYPHISVDAWVRLSGHRYRATHPAGNSAVLVVEAFGETLGQGISYGVINFKPSQRDQVVFADLIERAARLAAHRVACTEGTPLVRPDSEDYGVRGCCWWCGALPDQHVAVVAAEPQETS